MIDLVPSALQINLTILLSKRGYIDIVLLELLAPASTVVTISWSQSVPQVPHFRSGCLSSFNFSFHRQVNTLPVGARDDHGETSV